MKKSLILLIAAALLLFSCQKDESFIFDGTTWDYDYITLEFKGGLAYCYRGAILEDSQPYIINGNSFEFKKTIIYFHPN